MLDQKKIILVFNSQDFPNCLVKTCWINQLKPFCVVFIISKFRTSPHSKDNSLLINNQSINTSILLILVKSLSDTETSDDHCLLRRLFFKRNAVNNKVGNYNMVWAWMVTIPSAERQTCLSNPLPPRVTSPSLSYVRIDCCQVTGLHLTTLVCTTIKMITI